MLAVTSGGTIPDRGLFGVFTPEGSRVGELDEEMVYESRVGETFLLGATTWRIEEITRDRVVVTPAPGEPGKMPFWHGDSDRPALRARAGGRRVPPRGRRLDRRAASPTDCGLDELAVSNLRAYLAEEREATGGVLPTDRQIVVERFRDELGDWRICVLSPFGARVHAPWALGDRGQGARPPRPRGAGDLDRRRHRRAAARGRRGAAGRRRWCSTPTRSRTWSSTRSGRSALFAARFRENAARALLLPRRRPGSRTPLWQQRQRAADLLAVASQLRLVPDPARDLPRVPARRVRPARAACR